MVWNATTRYYHQFFGDSKGAQVYLHTQILPVGARCSIVNIHGILYEVSQLRYGKRAKYSESNLNNIFKYILGRKCNTQ